jgi:hypothetical protein
MSSQESVHDSPATVTPELGKGTLDTWWFHRQPVVGHRAGISRRIRGNEPVGKPRRKGCMRTSALASPMMGRPMEERPRFQTGPGKSGRPAL